MSKARLVIAAVIIEKRSPSEVAKSYGVARSWVYTLLDRYEAEGEAAFELRSPTGLASRAASAGCPLHGPRRLLRRRESPAPLLRSWRHTSGGPKSGNPGQAPEGTWCLPDENPAEL